LPLSILIFTASSFAQSNPQAPASWIAFEQQESAKRASFNRQMNAQRDAFLAANPDVQAYLDEMRAIEKAKMASWYAQHPPKNSNN